MEVVDLQVISLQGVQDLDSPAAADLLAAQAGEPREQIPAGARLWALEQGGAWQWLAGFAPLVFDSEVFGRALGRLAPLRHRAAWPQEPALAQGRALLAHLAEEACAQGLDCLMARVDGRDLLAAQALEAAGGRLLDVSVEYALDLAGLAAPPPPPPGLALRPWRPGEEQHLAELCAACFCDLAAYADRFALDPRLRTGCPELYRRWMFNSLAGEQADQVLVLAGDDLAGFITLRLPAGGGPGWVVLNALAADQRGQGLYNCLLAHGLAWLKDQGAVQARVRTKLSSRAVIRAWSRLGARQESSDLTFHLWLAEV